MPENPALNFDLRILVGLMFMVLSLILVSVGLFGGAALPAQCLGVSMNLWLGLVQLIFGLLMLGFGLRTKSKW